MAQSGNGVDIETIYQLLTQMSARLDQFVEMVNRQFDRVNSQLAEHSRIRADHGRQLDDLPAGMAEMRQEVAQYHAAVTGQGIHYSELEGRTLRMSGT